jgi:hypothetical protein
MQEVVDNTTGIVREVEHGDPESIADISTLLGPQYRMQRLGVVRPGIMSLKQGCSESDKKTYETMLAGGCAWDDIDQQLGKDNQGKSNLRPANVDYFTVHKRDCPNPANADAIMKYADDDGRLRSFPVWFPVNEWWNILPHSLRCFGANSIKYRSAFRGKYSEDGRLVDMIRVCEFPLPAERNKRTFGGRQWDSRPCNPSDCAEYQNGACKFGGLIHFCVPGTRGIGVWILPTTSWYSMIKIKSTLEMVAKLTRGKVAGLFDGKPIFRLMKVRDTVSRIDPSTGNAVRTAQWLIHLDADIDMTELAAYSETSQIKLRASNAVSILNGHATVHAEDSEPSRCLQPAESIMSPAEIEKMSPPLSYTEDAQIDCATVLEEVVDADDKDDKADGQYKQSQDNGEPATQGQKNAIKKLGIKLGVDETVIDHMLADIDKERAGEYIMRLNKGDKDMFCADLF